MSVNLAEKWYQNFTGRSFSNCVSMSLVSIFYKFSFFLLNSKFIFHSMFVWNGYYQKRIQNGSDLVESYYPSPITIKNFQCRLQVTFYCLWSCGSCGQNSMTVLIIQCKVLSIPFVYGMHYSMLLDALYFKILSGYFLPECTTAFSGLSENLCKRAEFYDIPLGLTFAVEKKNCEKFALIFAILPFLNKFLLFSQGLFKFFNKIGKNCISRVQIFAILPKNREKSKN